MPNFTYKAVDASGKVSSSLIAASNRKEAFDMLSSQGLFPSEIAEQDKKKTKEDHIRLGRISGADIEGFTRQLGNLLASGLPLSRALKILARESSKPAARQMWSSVYDMVSNGMSLADALRQFPRSFSSIYVAMVAAGETGGFLELVLQQIAEFRSREQDLKSRVQSALVYPIVLTVLAVFILIFLLVYFIPRFSSIFAEFGGSLPALTKAIVSASKLLTDYWIFIAGVVVLLVLGIRTYLSREEGKQALERFVLRIPIFGAISAKFAFVRFARMLGTLIEAGVPLISALQVAREAIGNRTLAAAVDDSVERVRKGSALSHGLRNCPKLFSGTNIEMISVAEESSRLGTELLRLAEVNEKNLDRNLKTAVSYAEPLMLFVMAAFVGTIVIGMLLPIFNLQELIH